MKRLRTGALGIAVAAAALAVPTTSSQAVVPGYVLDLQLNDPALSTTAVDSSGMGHHGQVPGSCFNPRTLFCEHVSFRSDPDGTRFARFDRHSPDEGVPYGFDHLITIPDAADDSLDPGTSNFTVEIRFRTKENFGNVLQKGQSRTFGGQVKIQAPKGRISCMFKTPQGTATAGSGTRVINDNVWHVVRCERTQASVTLYIDGVRVSRTNHFTGTLNNKKPWTIGGKSECDAQTVTCDYFSGDIDYVRMTKGL